MNKNVCFSIDKLLTVDAACDELPLSIFSSSVLIKAS